MHTMHSLKAEPTYYQIVSFYHEQTAVLVVVDDLDAALKLLEEYKNTSHAGGPCYYIQILRY